MTLSTLLRTVTAYMVISLTGCASASSSGDTSGAGYSQTGKASYYADKFQSRKTASGELFDQGALTAAHRKLPFGTKVRVTNVNNGKSVIVRVNDRGPFVKGRIIDLSRSAFLRIGNTKAGVISVRIQVLD